MLFWGAEQKETARVGEGGRAHSFIELDKAVVHVIRLVSLL